MHEDAGKASGSLVKSASRVLDIFELLMNQNQGLSLIEISRKLKLPVSSTYALIHTLLQRGYLENGASGAKTFRLRLKLLEIGSTYLQGFNLIDQAKPVMKELAGICDETVNLASLDKTDIIYVAKEEGTKLMRLMSYVGKRLPAHATALGRVLLSVLSDPEIDRLYGNAPLPKLTPQTITDLKLLKKQLRTVRIRGYAHDNEESTEGLQCVAAPVYNHESKTTAALSISVPTVRINGKNGFNELVKLALYGAQKISKAMGHIGDQSRLRSV